MRNSLNLSLFEVVDGRENHGRAAGVVVVIVVQDRWWVCVRGLA